jgi:hypothetical protein
MNHGLSDQVRSVAADRFVQPALRAGKVRFSVAVRDLMQHLEPMGFPARNWPQICTAIQAEKFLRAYGIEIEAIDGPPKKQSSTVVITYRFASPRAQRGAERAPIEGEPTAASSDETPEEWAHRMTGKLSGLLKDEIAAMGGSEAFLRWVRGYDEEDAP